MLNKVYSKNSVDSINNNRLEVLKGILSKSSNIKDVKISTISTVDLELMFYLYDQIFFDNWLKTNYQGKLKFSLSRRMTKSAGATIYPKNIENINPKELIIEIRIGVDFFYHYDIIEGRKTVCGIKTSSSLEALQLVFEHELCHMIEFILFKKSSCSRERFKTIANNTFGHSESYHKLPTNREIANKKLGLNVGDTVYFSFEGKRLKGIIYNINKRATVMVSNKKGIMIDNKGNRYSKYYVPLTHLKGL